MLVCEVDNIVDVNPGLEPQHLIAHRLDIGRRTLESLQSDLTEEFPKDRADERIREFQNLELLYPCGDGYVEYCPENDPWRQGERSA